MNAATAGAITAILENAATQLNESYRNDPLATPIEIALIHREIGRLRNAANLFALGTSI